MTKVNVDVQVLITGEIGSGKGLIMNRLREFLSKQVANGITQTDGFERQYADGCVFHVKGELLQNAGAKAPKETHANIPGYPDADKMFDYLTAKINETALSETLKSPTDTNVNVFINDAKGQPFKIVVDHASGNILAYREGESLHAADKVVTLLVHPGDDPAPSVGMDQVEAQAASTQASEATAGFATGGYVSPCALVKPSSIEFSKEEMQSGLNRVRWAEGLIRQLPTNHEGRNSWLKNYGTMSDVYAKEFMARMHECKAETGAPEKATQTLKDLMAGKDVPGSEAIEGAAPEPDAHNKANNVLLMLNPSIAQQFQPITYEDAVYPGGLVAGNKVQLIFDDGAIVIGNAGEFTWRKGQGTADIVYWRRM